MYKKTFLLTKSIVTDLLVINTKNLLSALENAAKPDDVADICLILHRLTADIIAQFTFESRKSLVGPKYRHVAEQFTLSYSRAYQLRQMHFPLLIDLYSRIVN